MIPDTQTGRLISASLLRLRTRAPFFALLSMFARIEISAYVPTAATDGRDIYVNEDFFLALPPPQQDGLMLHEVLHAALLHIPRRGAREPLLWNVAADIVINGMIDELRDFELPDGALRDRQLQHLNVEEVYELLLQDLDRFPAPTWGDLLEQAPPDAARPFISPDRQAVLETYWREAFQQAHTAHQASGRGNLPGNLARELKALQPAQLDWRSYLWRFVVQTPADFNEFDRRFVGRRLYLETLAGDKVRLFVAVDTSGSISGGQLDALMSEIDGMLRAYPHLDGELYYADAALYGPHAIQPGAPLPPPVGGGGTDFRPFFERVAAELDYGATAVCVYLTDGFGNFPEAAPGVPVLWVVTPGGLESGQFPFGEVIRLILSG
ncbi:MAG TPA: VWA-like domain-containing protein [Herpetosiphonaceae bacterium]